jgi:hypothetical protein
MTCRVMCIVWLIAIVGCGGTASGGAGPASPTPGVENGGGENSQASTDRDRAHGLLADFVENQKSTDPTFRTAYEARWAELEGQTPSAAQCEELPTLIDQLLPDDACDLSDPHCARPPDVMAPTTPGPSYPHGCSLSDAARTSAQTDPNIGGDVISVSGEEGSRLEGCDAAFRIWILERC